MYLSAIKCDIFILLGCASLCISHHPIVTCLFDTEDWHLLYVASCSRKKGGWCEKESGWHFQFFCDKLFPDRMKPFHDFPHVYTCPAPCLLKLYFNFTIESNSLLETISLPFVPYNSTKNKFLKDQDIHFYRTIKTQ